MSCSQDLFMLVPKVILEKTIRIPRSLSVKAASILKGFLNKNPADRLGCHRDSGFGEIMNHPFFKVGLLFEKICNFLPQTIEWAMLEQKQIPPPYRPRLENERDLANFPPEVRITFVFPDIVILSCSFSSRTNQCN